MTPPTLRAAPAAQPYCRGGASWILRSSPTTGTDTGEGPLWHDGEDRLYWVDIPNGKIFWYDPVTGEHDLHFEGPVLGGFTIQEDGDLLLFLERGGIALLRGRRAQTT